MNTNQRISKIQAEFWTAFGFYMKPVPSATGDKVNWINYKTNIKHLTFNLNFTNNSASLIIKISHPEIEEQKKFLKTFSLLKDELNNFPQPLIFKEYNSSSQFSTIESELKGVNIFNKETWPIAISFLKNSMIELDVFWQSNKSIFESL